MKIEEKRERIKRLGNAFNAYKREFEKAKKENFCCVIGKVTFVKRNKN